MRMLHHKGTRTARTAAVLAATTAMVVASAPGAVAQDKTFHDPDEGLFADIVTVQVSHGARKVVLDTTFSQTMDFTPTVVVNIDTNARRQGPEFYAEYGQDFRPRLHTTRAWVDKAAVRCPKLKGHRTPSHRGFVLSIPRKCLANAAGNKPPRLRVNLVALQKGDNDYAPRLERFYGWVKSG